LPGDFVKSALTGDNMDEGFVFKSQENLAAALEAISS
jgi:hypothetical protein